MDDVIALTHAYGCGVAIHAPNTELPTRTLRDDQHVFTTGRGTPYGLAMVPVIKVASRTTVAERWRDLIDVSAGTIASGDETIEQAGRRIFELILDIASGRRQTWADPWKLYKRPDAVQPDADDLSLTLGLE